MCRLSMVVLAVVSALSGAGTASAGYFLTDLGTLPTGASSDATAINSKGQVAGYSGVNYATTGGVHAFLWTGGQMGDLGTTSDSSLTMNFGFGLNDSGAVVGSTNLGTGAVYSNGTWSQLPGTSTAYAINDAGVIVGEESNGLGFIRTPDGAITSIGPSPAFAINQSGDVVGGSGSGLLGGGEAWYYSHTTTFTYPLNGLVTGYGAAMYGINDSGQMTGMCTYGDGSNPFGTPRAGAYFGGLTGACTDLGSLVPKSQQYFPSNGGVISVQGNGIAANGDIVGSMGFQNEGPYIPAGQHGFIYSAANHTVTDVNTVLDSSVPANWVVTMPRRLPPSPTLVTWARNGSPPMQRRTAEIRPTRCC